MKSSPEAAVTLWVGVIADDLRKLVSVGGEGAALVDWRRNSPLLQHVELSEVIISDRPKSAEGVQNQDYEQAGYEILAHGRDGPLVLKKRDGAKLAYHLLFHTDRSSLPYRLGFSILVQNLVQIARQHASLSEVHGERTGVLPAKTLQAETTYDITRPDGTRVRVKSNAEAELSGVPAPKIGRYVVSDGEDDLVQIGVSLLDARETKLSAVDEIRFREISVTAQESAVSTDRPLWYFLALAGFVLLLIEWWYFQSRRGRMAG